MNEMDCVSVIYASNTVLNRLSATSHKIRRNLRALHNTSDINLHIIICISSVRLNIILCYQHHNNLCSYVNIKFLEYYIVFSFSSFVKKNRPNV